MVALDAQKLPLPNLHRRKGVSELPFGYYVECDPDLSIVRRPDGWFVAAFSAGGADPFELEAAVWEDAE